MNILKKMHNDPNWKAKHEIKKTVLSMLRRYIKSGESNFPYIFPSDVWLAVQANCELDIVYEILDEMTESKLIFYYKYDGDKPLSIYPGSVLKNSWEKS